MLKVMPTKRVQRFGIIGKLSPQYIRPFEILERVGSFAYNLALPPQLSHVHNVFHVLMLCKYMPDPEHIIDYQTLKERKDALYKEAPMCILDNKEKVLRTQSTPSIKVQWQCHSPEKATWELEDEMK